MAEQMIISISREYGSCGHEIAELVAKELGIALYDRNLLDAVADEMDMSADKLRKFDEKPRNIFMTRSVNGHSNAMEDVVMQMQFEYLQKKAAEGESFVVVGRCGETALKEYKNLIRVFVMGDKQCKIDHIMKKFRLSEDEAETKMNRHDVRRKAYHNRYSDSKWGDSRTYDICIKIGKVDVDTATDMIIKYIDSRDN